MKQSVKNLLFYTIICIIYIALSNYPLFLEIKHTPDGTVFPLYHTNSDFDYNAYLSVILQGKNGAWRMTNPFSHETFNPTVFYFFYILVGKLAAILSLAPHHAYHIVRSIGVLAYVTGIYVVAIKVLGKKKGFWASIFAIVATFSPLPFFREPEGFVNYLPWWYNLEALKRLDQMPHYMISSAILFFSSAGLFDLMKKERTVILVTILCALFFAGIIFPPMMLPIVFALPLGAFYTHLYKWIKTRNFNIKKHQIIPIILMVLVVGIAYLIIMNEKNNGFPWNTWNDWEKSRWSAVTAFEQKLMVSFGLLPLLAFPGALSFLSSSSIGLSFIVFWGYLPFILLPFIHTIGLSNFRVTTVAPFIPLSILTAQTAFLVSSFVAKKIDRTTMHRIVYALLSKSIIILVLVINIPITISVLPKVRSITMISKVATRFMHYYVPQSDWDGIMWLRDHAEKEAVVLTNRYLGNLVPAHALVKTYIGHHVHTKDFFSKDAFVNKFFNGFMTPREAKAFLTTTHITYIFYSLLETMGAHKPNYSFLEMVFETPGTVIYKVKH